MTYERYEMLARPAIGVETRLSPRVGKPELAKLTIGLEKRESYRELESASQGQLPFSPSPVRLLGISILLN